MPTRKIGGPQVVGRLTSPSIDIEGYVHLLASSNGAYVGRLATDGIARRPSQPRRSWRAILLQTRRNVYGIATRAA